MEHTRSSSDLVIIHRFPEVNTKIDSLLYYITINGDKVYDGTKSTFVPDLISTVKISGEDDCVWMESKAVVEKYSTTDQIYKSIYSLPIPNSKSDDVVMLYIIFPFDYKTNIIDYYLDKRH